MSCAAVASPRTPPTVGNLPPPIAADIKADERPYNIGPFDKLIIDVYGVDDMKAREIQADASGRISFPLAGVIEAAGKTPLEIADVIAQRLRAGYIRNPQVTVNLKETSSQVITVDGEVQEPGIYPVVGHMSLLRAVATAKGTTEFAKQKRVVIFRTVNGQKLAGLYDLRSIRQGLYDDPEVFANDIVVVGDNAARRLLKDVLQALPAVVTPLVYVLAR
jgi:polysaccharide biosynthesis/export protein